MLTQSENLVSSLPLFSKINFEQIVTVQCTKLSRVIDETNKELLTKEWGFDKYLDKFGLS